MKIYDQKALETNSDINFNRAYQQSSISVMDTIADPNITFDEKGICNYYYEYKEAEKKYVLHGEKGEQLLHEQINKIRNYPKKDKYDCILGLSGGVDSTYLCLLAKEQGLNPLVVHFDNGWNSELATHNIHHTVEKLEFDLYTHVVDWHNFKELQLAYLKASVVDIEVLTDHAFMAILYQQARKFNIKFVLAGMNIVTEQVLPKYWIYNKGDLVNIKDIHKKFGTIPTTNLKNFPFLDQKIRKYCNEVLKIEIVEPLNYIPYNYDEVKERIIKELDWRDYGGKHYESVWTRFYQGYILPKKFHIDKRKAHLSNLIFSGQITKDEALSVLSNAPYPSEELLQADKEFVLKKLELTEKEFNEIMSLPRKEHTDYKVQQSIYKSYPILKPLKPLVDKMRKLK